MLVFRSEAHVQRWLGDRRPGRTVPIATLGELANRWWGDRISPDWQPHSRDGNQAILDSLGLTGDFWRLP
jgi:hypothetical protein